MYEQCLSRMVVDKCYKPWHVVLVERAHFGELSLSFVRCIMGQMSVNKY